MQQLSLPFRLRKLNVDGMHDKKGVWFIGDAIEQLDGTWQTLANVGGALCWVEVKVTWLQ
jgi:hypothetical protein